MKYLKISNYEMYYNELIQYVIQVTSGSRNICHKHSITNNASEIKIINFSEIYQQQCRRRCHRQIFVFHSLRKNSTMLVNKIPDNVLTCPDRSNFVNKHIINKSYLRFFVQFTYLVYLHVIYIFTHEFLLKGFLRFFLN